MNKFLIFLGIFHLKIVCDIQNIIIYTKHILESMNLELFYKIFRWLVNQNRQWRAVISILFILIIGLSISLYFIIENYESKIKSLTEVIENKNTLLYSTNDKCQVKIDKVNKEWDIKFEKYRRYNDSIRNSDMNELKHKYNNLLDKSTKLNEMANELSNRVKSMKK